MAGAHANILRSGKAATGIRRQDPTLPPVKKRASAQRETAHREKPETSGDSGEFYVLSSSYAYGGTCGYDSRGIERHPNMLAALEAQLEWLLQFDEERFEEGEYCQEKESLEDTIAEIRSRETDLGVKTSCLGIDGRSIGYATLASGYWRDFVAKAVPVLMDDLQYRIDQADEGDGVVGVDAVETDSELADWKEELSRLKALSKRCDVESESFATEFWDLASEYE
jgi:hypothetical protein